MESQVSQQAAIYSIQPGASVLVAKCTSGKMNVIEIASQIQNDLTAASDSGIAVIQFFEGIPPSLPAGSGGGISSLSLQLQVQRFQLWSKPGRIVQDDVYLVNYTSIAISISVEVNYQSICG